MRIDDLKDETIKTLARTLKASGLAASESEAIRMATNMSQTNKKVNSNFEERKERNTMGLSFLHKEVKHDKPHQRIVEEEVYAREVPQHHGREAPQHYGREEPQMHPEEEVYADDNCESCGCCSHHEDGLDDEKPLNDLFEAETKDEFIAQDLFEKEEEKIVEKTREIIVERSEPKKDLSQYKESKVSLSDVFRFKG